MHIAAWPSFWGGNGAESEEMLDRIVMRGYDRDRVIAVFIHLCGRLWAEREICVIH